MSERLLGDEPSSLGLGCGDGALVLDWAVSAHPLVASYEVVFASADGEFARVTLGAGGAGSDALDALVAEACTPCTASLVPIDGVGAEGDVLLTVEVDTDGDGDGYGAATCGGSDCADDDDAVNPGAEEACNGVDDDCNAVVDDLANAPLATLQEGVCAGARQVCDGDGGWAEPDYTALSGYEVDELSCDGLDNDCNGQDDDLDGAPDADLTAGVCAGATKICDGSGGWVEPDYTAITGYEATETRCDGVDNDCSGQADDLDGAPDAGKQDGVCAGAKQVCDGSGGWVEPDYAQIAGYAETDDCDGLDNDCDDDVDDELVAVAASLQDGVCAGAERVCDGSNGWVEPDYTLIATYEATEASCDGLDNDCNGFDDDIVDPQLADLQDGVCTGAVKDCDGSNGWVEPDYTEIATYEATEASCDGLDNDCNGFDDDLASAPPADEQAGVCAGAVKVCDGAGGWDEPDYAATIATFEATELSCDGLDNDCGGTADDVALADTPFMDAPGVCGEARQVCAGSNGWQDPPLATIANWEAVEVSCDGLDNDCDDVVDTRYELDEAAATLECVGEYIRITPERVLDGPWAAVVTNRVTLENTSVACALDAAGALSCWGDNEFWQMGGIGSNLTGRQPAQLPGAYDEVAMGGEGIVAVGDDGTLWQWGREPGQGTTALAVSSPRQLGTDADWRSASIGSNHACAVKTDDSLWCWGRFADGQLGPNITTYSKDTPADAQLASVSQVSAGHRFTCAVRPDESLWCWGVNGAGQVGVDSAGADVTTPNEVVHPTGLGWSMVSAGQAHACALDADDEAWCWGQNSGGQLGNGDTAATPVPQPVPSGPWSTVLAGKGATCASGASGTSCWGNHENHALGVPAAADVTSPTLVDAGLTGDIALGQAWGCGLDASGALWCWGDEFRRATGPGPDAFQELTDARLRDVGWGTFHGCYLDDADGSLWCVGGDRYASLGDGLDQASSVPVQVHAGPFSKLVHSQWDVCALTALGERYCWGRNLYGELGNGIGTGEVTTPTLIDDGPWRDLYFGTYDSCGIKDDKSQSLWCWGSDGEFTPQLLSTTEVWRDLAVSQQVVCGILDLDDEIYCWGMNTYAELGQGSQAPATFDYAGRQAIYESGPWESITAGSRHMCAVKVDGSGWCWGNDDYGQLGDGFGDNDAAQLRFTTGRPQDIGGQWATIEAAIYRTCGIDDLGELWCWGDNQRAAFGLDPEAESDDYPWPEFVDDGPFVDVIPSHARTCATRAQYTTSECP